MFRQRNVEGEELSAAIHENLHKTVQEKHLRYINSDLIVVLKDLSVRLEVEIMVDDSVYDIPRSQRSWNCTPGDKTLREILLEELPKDFKQLRVILKFDKILVTATPAPAQNDGFKPPPNPVTREPAMTQRQYRPSDYE